MAGYVVLVDGTVYDWMVECFLKSPGSLVAASSATVSKPFWTKNSQPRVRERYVVDHMELSYPQWRLQLAGN